MRLSDEIVHVHRRIVERGFEEEHDVVDGVLERDEVHELAQIRGGLGAEVLELLDELLNSLLPDGRRRNRRRLVCEEGSVVGLLEVELDVVEVVALGDVVKLNVGQKSQAVAADEGLGEPAETKKESERRRRASSRFRGVFEGRAGRFSGRSPGPRVQGTRSEGIATSNVPVVNVKRCGALGHRGRRACEKR